MMISQAEEWADTKIVEGSVPTMHSEIRYLFGSGHALKNALVGNTKESHAPRNALAKGIGRSHALRDVLAGNTIVNPLVEESSPIYNQLVEELGVDPARKKRNEVSGSGRHRADD